MKQELLDTIASSLQCDSDRAAVVQVLIDSIEADVRQFKESADQNIGKEHKAYALVLAEEAAVDLPFLTSVKEHLLRK